MRYMTYPYRLSKLIATEFLYRELYQESLTFPDSVPNLSTLRYANSLSSSALIHTVETLEQEFNRTMDPKLNVTKFWKLFKFENDELFEELNSWLRESLLTASSLRRIREYQYHKEPRPSKKRDKKTGEMRTCKHTPYDDDLEQYYMGNMTAFVSRASAFLDLPLAYMMQIFKYEDGIIDGMIDEEFLNEEADYRSTEGHNKSCCFWKDIPEKITLKKAEKKDDTTDTPAQNPDLDPWMEQYIRLIRRPALLHRRTMQAALGYQPYQTSGKVLNDAFLQAECYKTILLHPVLYNIHDILHQMKHQNYAPQHLELYRTFLGMQPNDAFYLSYLACLCCDTSKTGRTEYEAVKTELLKFSTIRKGGDERFLALLNMATNARNANGEIAPQKLPAVLDPLHFVGDIRFILENTDAEDYDEKELEESIFSSRQIVSVSSLFGDNSESQALTPNVDKMKPEELESHVLSCLEAAYWLVNVHTSLRQQFDELMTLYSVYLFLTKAQKNHFELRPDKNFFQSFISDELKEAAIRYFQ